MPSSAEFGVSAMTSADGSERLSGPFVYDDRFREAASAETRRRSPLPRIVDRVSIIPSSSTQIGE